MLHHMVFSGPERAAESFVDHLMSAGYPAQIDPHCGGFEPELLTTFVEAIGVGFLGDATYPGDGSVTFTDGSPLDLAQREEFALRLHGVVDNPTMVLDPLLDRLVELEARLADLEAR